MQALDLAVEDINLHISHTKELEASVDTTSMSEKELWLFNRRKGIGGSDAGAILGVNNYTSPLDLYNDKHGLSEQQESSDAAHFGNVLEDVVAQEYMRRTGKKVQRRNQTFFHPDYPWMAANLDRVIVGEKKILECKTADKWFANSEAWGKGNSYELIDGEWVCTEVCDEVPETYLLQCLHYMIVTGKNQADLAVLMGGNQFRIYTINYNQDLADILIEAERNFWIENVCLSNPPEPVNNNDLDTLYLGKVDPKKTIVATSEIIDTYCEFKMIQEQIKALEAKAFGVSVGGKKMGGLDFKIKKFMGDASEILIDDEGKKLCSFKEQSRESIDTSALKKAHKLIAAEFTKKTSYRVFRA